MLIALRVNELMNSRTLEDRDNLILSFISFSERMYVPFFFFFKLIFLGQCLLLLTCMNSFEAFINASWGAARSGFLDASLRASTSWLMCSSTGWKRKSSSKNYFIIIFNEMSFIWPAGKNRIKLWSSQVSSNSRNSRKEAGKNSGFDGKRTCASQILVTPNWGNSSNSTIRKPSILAFLFA